MILNTKRIHISFWRKRAKRMPSKALFIGKKSDERGRSVIARQICNRLQQ